MNDKPSGLYFLILYSPARFSYILPFLYFLNIYSIDVYMLRDYYTIVSKLYFNRIMDCTLCEITKHHCLIFDKILSPVFITS